MYYCITFALTLKKKKKELRILEHKLFLHWTRCSHPLVEKKGWAAALHHVLVCVVCRCANTVLCSTDGRDDTIFSILFSHVMIPQILQKSTRLLQHLK